MIGAWHAPVSMADKESVDVRSEVHRPQERIAINKNDMDLIPDNRK